MDTTNSTLSAADLMGETTLSVPSEAPVAVVVVAPAPASSVIVDRWFGETFFNLGIDVDLYNRFYAAKERLKELLAAQPKE